MGVGGVGTGSIMSRQGGGGQGVGSQSQLGMSQPGGSTAAISYSGDRGYQGGQKGPGGPGSLGGGGGNQQGATMSVADLGMGGMENGALLGNGGQSEINLNSGNGAPEYAVLKARALYSCQFPNIFSLVPSLVSTF